MIYKHTQVGYIFFIVISFMSIFFLYLDFNTTLESYVYILQGLILFVILSFSSLTVSVNSNELKVRFWYWLFRKTFNISDIVSVKIAKNKWYTGYWIRYHIRPFKTIYNVSGLMTVEIVTREWKIFRIWTDEPEKLRDAILSQIS